MNLKGKRLLILGAGRGQIGLYRAAKEMGITTIAGTMPDNNPPCIPLADEVCYMNIIDPDEVESKTRDLQFDGVATCCLDRGLKALGRLCDRRSLPGYSESTATLCADKLAMKRRLMEHGVNTAEYAEVSNVEELAEAVDAIGGYPVIIKAVDLAGSMGINKAFNEKEAIRGFKNSMDATRRSHVIVERLLQGREFGAQAFITDGKVLFVMPHGDILYHSSTDVPVGHYVPFDCPAEMADKITAETEKAIKALGLDNCAVNIDFIEEDGKVYVLELSGRIGANGLPEVVSATSASTITVWWYSRLWECQSENCGTVATETRRPCQAWWFRPIKRERLETSNTKGTATFRAYLKSIYSPSPEVMCPDSPIQAIVWAR